MNKNKFFDSSDLSNDGNYTIQEILYVLKKHVKIILIDSLDCKNCNLRIFENWKKYKILFPCLSFFILIIKIF